MKSSDFKGLKGYLLYAHNVEIIKLCLVITQLS